MGEAGREAHVLGLGVEADPVEPRLRVSRARRDGGLDPERAAASRTSPIPTGAACGPTSSRAARASLGLEVYNAGCELEVGRGLAASTGTTRSKRTGALVRDRRGRLPPSRASTARSPGRGCARRSAPAAAVLEALRAAPSTARRAPRSRSSTVEDDIVEVRTQPGAERHLAHRSHARRERECRQAAATRTAAEVLDAVARRRDHRAHGSSPPSRRPTRASRSPTERTQGVDEPAVDLSWSGQALERLAGPALRPARHRRRDHRRRDRARGEPGRARGRARRPRRLRRGDLERVLEAHPRRAPLPPPRRHPARPGGAPGAPRAHARGRAPPRPPADVPAPALRAAARTAASRSRPGSGSTRRSRASGSEASSGPSAPRGASPAFGSSRLQGCGLYSDAWTHDSRLCLANVRAAAERGAVVLNYAEAVELSGRRTGGSAGARQRRSAARRSRSRPERS